MANTLQSLVKVPSINRTQFGKYLDSLALQRGDTVSITYTMNVVEHNTTFTYSITGDTIKLVQEVEELIREGAYAHGG